MSDTDRISIERWPAGEHYYVTVDGKDVQDTAGNVKWETYEDAMKAALEYIAKHALPNVMMCREGRAAGQHTP